MRRKIIFILLLWSVLAPAQTVRRGYSISTVNAESALQEESLRYRVAFLTDSLAQGRATGSAGSAKVIGWLANSFATIGLQPVGGTWFHGFRTPAGQTGHNVIGLLPGNGAATRRYVIVTAHFDHIGTLAGNLYPGADSNASGVAAMLSVAEMVRKMNEVGKTYANSVLFVALDGKEQSLSGAENLWKLLENKMLKDPVTGGDISPKDIEMVINIDQVGSTLSPLRKNRPDYLLMLSDPKTGRRESLLSANRSRRLDLDLGFDYYGSKDFTTLFFRRISDQRIFLENGIPAVMFTSGITLNNNKPYDNAASLDYAVMKKRIILMFNYLVRVL